MRIIGTILCLAVVLTCLPTAGPAQTITHSWFINDGAGTVYWWGDSDPQLGAYWEWMGPGYIETGDTVCAQADVLQPVQEYYAASQVEASMTYAGNFWAVLYLSNNYENHNNPVYAAVGYGTPGNPASFTQVTPTVTGNVTNLTMGCGMPYNFNFGGPHFINLTNQSVIIKIWTDVAPGDVHIYWDADCCPSALYLDNTVGVEPSSWGVIKRLNSD
ncbi:MAG: hypothetical protein KOO63_14980 [Bacteroidales bacterium]|nr:hypothetical protein [Candidatus Latescibacterota bacterium]